MYEAFANIYKVWINTLLKKANGEKLDKYDYDFPSIDDGISEVKFIHACIKSHNNASAWTDL